jgi:hypothetical protein
VLQVLVGGVVEVVDADADLLQAHRPHDRSRHIGLAGPVLGHARVA